jgi:hypothetical protein
MSCGLTTGLLWLMTSLAAIESGPAVGEEFSPLMGQVIADGKADAAADLLPAHLKYPTLYVFISGAKFERPAAAYLREIDALAQQLQRKEPLSQMVVIWLADDIAAGTERILRVQQALQFTATQWAIHPGPAAGPEGWKINERATVTVVVGHREKVAATFAYDSVNATDIGPLKAIVEKLPIP